MFASIWTTYISSPLQNLWTSISDWFTSLGTGAYQSGTNFVSMLAQGIASGAGAIWNAVTGIASQIWKGLGFHSPTKEGPGSDADVWMPNLIKTMSLGLTQGAPQIGQATQVVAQQIAYPVQSARAYTASVVPSAPASKDSLGGNHTTIIELDGHELARIVQSHTDRQVRLKLGAKGRVA